MLKETHIPTTLNPVAIQHVQEAENLLKFFKVHLKNSLQSTLLNMNLLKANSCDAFYQPFKQIMKSLSNIDAYLMIAYNDKEINICKGNFSDAVNAPIKLDAPTYGKELEYLSYILDIKQLSYLSPKPIIKLISKALPDALKTTLWGLEVDSLHTSGSHKVFMLLSISDKETYNQFQM